MEYKKVKKQTSQLHTDAKAFPRASAVCVPPEPSLEVGAERGKVVMILSFKKGQEKEVGENTYWFISLSTQNLFVI